MTEILPKKQFHIAIVGGGLGGLSLAIGLERRGVAVQVYEGASAFTDNGAGLVFAKNSMDAMKKVSPDIYSAFSKRSSKQGWENKQSNYMDYRNGMTDGELITTLTCADVGQQSIHRTLFVKDLVGLLSPGTFHLGKKVSSLHNRDDGGFILEFADGGLADADAVVGCDGIKSKCRQILLGENSPAAKPQYSKEFAYRGMVPMERAVAILGDEFARNSMVNVGKNGLTTTYPVEKGTLLNIVAARSLESWEHEEWVVPSNQEKLLSDFEGFGPVVQKILSMLDNPSKWALFDHPECPTFYKGRLAIIGDSAHASTPHQGAGCGQAFEDSLVMCNLLADDSITLPEHIENAFKAYDAIRRPRSLKVVNSSRENGEICMMRGEGTGDDLSLIKKSLDERFKWIWYEDLDEQVKEAKNRLQDIVMGGRVGVVM